MKKLCLLLAFLMLCSLCSCAKVRQNQDTPVGADAPAPTEPLLRNMPGHTPTVVLDAGHGFGDVGCAGPETALGAWEREMTIDMVLTLKDCFEARGVRVLLTHDGESFPSTDELSALCDRYGVEYDTTKDQWKDDNIFSPYERVLYMNCLDAQYGVNYALSVHVNSNADSDRLNGFDLDYCKENPYSKESAVFAYALKDALEAAYPGRNLWFYEDSWEDAFVVTKYNTMPSALLETAYYTNPEDLALLRDRSWRDGLMEQVCDTICSVLEGDNA